MATMKLRCPAALPVAGTTPSCGGVICRVETSEAGMRGDALEASFLTPRTDPATLVRWCHGAYSTCPTYRADQDNRRALALAEQE